MAIDTKMHFSIGAHEVSAGVCKGESDGHPHELDYTQAHINLLDNYMDLQDAIASDMEADAPVGYSSQEERDQDLYDTFMGVD